MKKITRLFLLGLMIIAISAFMPNVVAYEKLDTYKLSMNMIEGKAPGADLIPTMEEIHDKYIKKLEEEEIRKDIRNTQNVLIKLKYPVKINSVMDEATVNAIKDFQKKYDLYPDGVVGEETRKCFDMALNPSKYIKNTVSRKIASRGGNIDLDVMNAINKAFSNNQPNSVFIGKGGLFVKLGNKYEIDPILMASIMALETGWGTSPAVINKNNPAGIMTNGGKTIASFSSLEAGMDASFSNIKRNYFDKGRNTIDKIAPVYAPVGASNDINNTNENWKPLVKKNYNTISNSI